jgi:hypothetical protein
MTDSDTRTPYETFPPEAFWRSAVTGRTVETVGIIHRAKFPIDRSMKIAMAGSCFAQRLSRHLLARGFTVIDREPAPPGLTGEEEKRYGFGLYSARYGNVYTARQLRLLAEEAFGSFEPGNVVWTKDGRYYDALRPSVEPEGLETPRAVHQQRKFHLRQVREVIATADVFVFTLGLTEAWIDARNGTVYPTAPGVVCGTYDPARHAFKNFTAQETHADLQSFLRLAKAHNPNMKLVLTVSPQRPVATATGKHVLAAAFYSKAALRAAAGQLESEEADVDYFPSYEMVTSPLAGNRYFNDNLRTVSDAGAALVMDAFLAAYGGDGADQQPVPAAATPPPAAPTPEDVVCEDEIIDAFAS